MYVCMYVQWDAVDLVPLPIPCLLTRHTQLLKSRSTRPTARSVSFSSDNIKCSVFFFRLGCKGDGKAQPTTIEQINVLNKIVGEHFG